jgi:hypothetical protein
MIETQTSSSGDLPIVRSIEAWKYPNLLLKLCRDQSLQGRGWAMAQLRGRRVRHLEWVDWFNNRRLLEPIGNIPSAEAEQRYYTMLEQPAKAA